ncbi:DUF5050 domain-containing protein [Clostridiales bacterium COT073_COT-073]|nr:DUF5050 domain-containing protein [Clostridiales bacterium COT073_COT-073]
MPSLTAAQTVKIPATAFKEPFYFSNNQIFYFINRESTIDFWRQGLHGQAELIGSASITPAPNDGFHYVSVYPGNDMIFTSHFGSHLMGSNAYYRLPESGPIRKIPGDHYSFLQPWHQKIVAGPSSVSGPQASFYLIDTNGQQTPLGQDDKYYLNGVVKGDSLFVQAQAAESSQHYTAGIPFYQIDLNTGKHQLLLPKVSSFQIGANFIYYRQSQEDKDLYRFDLSSHQSEKLVSLYSAHAPGYANQNTFFSAIYLNTEDSDFNINLYRIYDRKLELIGKAIKKPLFSDSHVVYQQFSKTGNPIIIADSSGMAKAKIDTGQKQIDYFLNGNQLIVWSWQDETVRYYKLP